MTHRRLKNRDKVGAPLEEFIEEQEAKHDEWQLWVCPRCGVRNVDAFSEKCQNCGGDFMGRKKGPPPPETEREARAGLRGDVAQGFTKDEYDSEFG